MNGDAAGSAEPIRKLAQAGARWMSLPLAVSAGVHFLRAFILARFFLEPADFGLMGLTMAVIFIAGIFTDLGMSPALVYRQDVTRRQFSSVFYANLGAGICLVVLLVSAAPFVSLLLNEPRLTPLLRVTALAFLFQSVTQPFLATMQRELRFRTIALQEVTAALVSVFLTIYLAWQGYGVWSLVWGFLAQTVSTCCLVLLANPGQLPLSHFARDDLSGFLGVGLFQLGTRTIARIAARTDQLVLGQIVGVGSLGYYSLAQSISLLPLQRVIPIFTRVALPSLAKIQRDITLLRDGYFLGLSMLFTVIAPVLIGVAAIADDLVVLVMGGKWKPVVPVLQNLCIAGLFRISISPSETLLLVRGYADRIFYWNLICFGLTIPVCVIAANLGGIAGVAGSLVVLHLLFMFAAYGALVRPALGPSFRRYINACLRPILLALSIPICVTVVGLISGGVVGPAGLLIKIPLSASVYCFLAALFLRKATMEIMQIAGLGRFTARLGSLSLTSR